MRDIDIRVERIVPQIETPPAPDWTPDPEYRTWSDEDVAAHYRRVEREHQRRQVLKAATEASEQALVNYRAAAGIHDGMEWRQPLVPLDAVQPGEARMWEGALYENVSGQPAFLSPGAAPALWALRSAPAVPGVPEPESEAPGSGGEV